MSHTSDLHGIILCYVTDRRSLPAPAGLAGKALPVEAHLLQKIEAAASAGIDWIQLREKDISGRELILLARAALERIRARNSSARLLINDRLDVALASGAGGVHLSESGLPVAEARRLRDDFFVRCPGNADFLIGVSCHSLPAATAAVSSGADYIYFGPVFGTPSKAGYGEPQGLNRLAQVCRATRIPVLAIGGIGPENAAECLKAGAAGIAAIRHFQEAEDLTAAATTLRSPDGVPHSSPLKKS